MKDKIAKLDNLNIEHLSDAILIIAEKLGYKGIVVSSNGVIEAHLDNGFGETKDFFFLFCELLSGNIDFNKIADKIAKVRTSVSINAITIISSKNISKGFQDTLSRMIADIKVNYVGRDNLIPLLDSHYPDFWKHDDSNLIHYENDFATTIKEDNQLKKLKLSSEYSQKLLSIFIEPSLSYISEDTQTHTLVRHRIDKMGIINENKPAYICGLSGSGKTTLLKNIGLSLIEENQQCKIKNLPIFISSLDILQNDLDINKIIRLKLDRHFAGRELKKLSKEYRMLILIDSIDEFEQDIIKKIHDQLNDNFKKLGICYLIGTRDSDSLQDSAQDINIRRYNISRFNTAQMQRFISAFLSDDKKTSDLLEAIRNNKILDRLPITPLTLSLITILFEETDFEIPATVTDIYNNFNSLIIGRAIVSSKIDFIDASFRERVLSRYGLMLLESTNHHPLTEEEFYDDFEAYFRGKTLPIDESILRDVLSYLIHQTGILYINDKHWVCFSHDSYMEYYAALEIFKFERNKEEKIVENFFDIHWQNVAVFYGGITKDMPEFAEEVNNKIQLASRMHEFIASIQGGGYLLQSLYQMDNTIKAKIVGTCLDKVLESNEVLKKLSSDDSSLFKNYRIPIIQLINFIHFYEMFNSVTLAKSLELTFNQLYDEYNLAIAKGNNDKGKAIGFKLVELAFTLDSKRIGNSTFLEKLIDDNSLLKDPNLYAIATFSFDLLGKNTYSDMRKELQHKFYSLNELRSKLIETSTSKIRFSLIDSIKPDRKVKIFVEGKTDAQILEHAFMVLTNGQSPYWNISMATINGETGSSDSITRTIEGSLSFVTDYDAIIGLYDHDKAGLSEYRRLDRDYIENLKDSIKKHKKGNIYLVLLPVPGEMSNYLQKKQDYNIFEIEHLFGHDFLKKHNMLRETPLDGIFEIVDSRKTAFAELVCNEFNPDLFRNFVPLFEIIDGITGTLIEYNV